MCHSLWNIAWCVYLVIHLTIEDMLLYALMHPDIRHQQRREIHMS